MCLCQLLIVSPFNKHPMISIFSVLIVTPEECKGSSTLKSKSLRSSSVKQSNHLATIFKINDKFDIYNNKQNKKIQ